jgi:hypothetical protein
MQYLLLIYGDETRRTEMPPEEQEVTLKAWWDYQDWLSENGWYQGGEALQPTSATTTVRERDGEILTIDGPFMETKEQLGGYFLIDCENLDQAIEAASRMPIIPRQGSVEIRPIQTFVRAGQPS